MAETHLEVVKVWIEPGCIVCDACESDCPEVFEVQEETCIVRPEAKAADFTQPLTPSIIVAAEGCPVDVIKFDTVEVEGPDPWEGQEEAAESATATSGAAPKAKKAGWEPPAGPPDPKWADLLASSHTSGSRSAGGPAVESRDFGTESDSLPAKAPAHAIESAVTSVTEDAPPDAYAAAMVGAGFSRPRPGATERIRKVATQTSSMTRRTINWALVVAWAALSGVGATCGMLFNAFLIPRLTREPDPKFRAGKIGDYAESGVYEQFKGSQNVWIVHNDAGELVALSTICTHLGCIPNWLNSDQKFKCPCHGSGFTKDGINFEGPAPRPLERHAISLDGENVVIDKSKKYREELGQWESSESKVVV